MILPFILTPVVLTGISSLAMYLNLVPVASQSVEWTVPVLFSGYMATGSFRGKPAAAREPGGRYAYLYSVY